MRGSFICRSVANRPTRRGPQWFFLFSKSSLRAFSFLRPPVRAPGSFGGYLVFLFPLRVLFVSNADKSRLLLLRCGVNVQCAVSYVYFYTGVFRPRDTGPNYVDRRACVSRV